MNKIRVLIVEDSPVVRRFLEHLIGHDPRLEVCAAVGSAEEALALLHDAAPDVISMDVRLPGLDGLEATRRIMTERPTPVVVVSASVAQDEQRLSLNALRAGALAVVEKPPCTSHVEHEALARRLCTQLAIMSQVKVVRQWPARSAPMRTCGATPVGPFRMLGVVASTGGPRALAQLLGALPGDFPLPILLVQHITATFHDGFASWLATVGPFPVVLARDGEIPQPGRIYLPPADHHLLLEGGRLYGARTPPVAGQRPSGTALFRSMARGLGPAALAVLLTGMGEDGAAGLAEVRTAGGYTIAEDESTAVVWGMPGAAARLGAACELLPLPAIAPRLCALSDGTQK